MKIYQPGTRGKRTVFAQPGRDFPVSHFLNADGSPKTFSVSFTEGAADVEDGLGEYLIKQGVAKSSPIILF